MKFFLLGLQDWNCNLGKDIFIDPTNPPLQPHPKAEVTRWLMGNYGWTIEINTIDELHELCQFFNCFNPIVRTFENEFNFPCIDFHRRY